MKLIRMIPLIVLIAVACIERVELPVLYEGEVLVVDGSITDEQGPHVVKLYYNFPVRDDSQYSPPLADASVKIVDDLGNSEGLVQTKAGTYSTSENFRGVVGRSYQLQIETTEGKKYESELTTLSPAGAIADMYFEFRENSINENDLAQPQDAFFVFINSTGVDATPNLFRWRWKGIYFIETFPQLNVLREGIGSTPDPLPCSGFIAGPGGLEKIGPCECCYCWVHERNDDVNISDTRNVSGGKFNRVLIAKIPFERRRFTDRYHIEIEQLSLSENVYDFWRMIDIQKRGASDIFQPNAIKITGNVKSVSDPDEKVFGVFNVSAVSKRSLFIDRSDVPKPVFPSGMAPVDCRTFRRNSTTEKPPFW
jgi:hypothetical protein